MFRSFPYAPEELCAFGLFDRVYRLRKGVCFLALSRLKLLAQKALSCLAALFLSLLFGFFVCDSGYIKIQISG